jgi:hypothetical protein
MKWQYNGQNYISNDLELYFGVEEMSSVTGIVDNHMMQFQQLMEGKTTSNNLIVLLHDGDQNYFDNIEIEYGIYSRIDLNDFVNTADELLDTATIHVDFV